MLRRAVRVAAVVGALAFIVSCSLIVSGDVPAVNCSGTGLDACPKGKYCKGAGCVDCEKKQDPPQDACDGYDNDCDGQIDNGPASDADGDTYTWCGQTGPRDCDDNDPSVHPNAEEVCNSKDDDCNTTVDDTCPPNTKCAVKLKQCVVPQCDPNSMTNDCMTGLCDPGTLKCVTPATKKVGDPCNADIECEPGAFCANSDVLTPAVVPSGSVCTKDCCRSDQCAANAVCFGSGKGNFCVSSAKLGRTTGNDPAGAPAATGATCRSGLAANGKCIDVCCGQGDCGNGTGCVYTQVAGRDTLGCDTAGMGCGTCANGACVQYGFPLLATYCRPTCCNSTSCPNIGIVPTTCWNETSNNIDYVPLCTRTQFNGVGSKNAGEQCSANSDCRSMRCLNSSYCTDACCLDRDCPQSPIPMACRPSPVGSVLLLRCLKK
jgi:hypothetical protein